LEASLDIQYISSIGFGATTWWISDDDTHNQQEPFLAYMVLLSNTTDTPWVHSISYADLEWSQNTAYTQRVDTEMAKAGLRGKLGIFFHGSMVFFRQQFPNTIINIIF
jgi:tripeptidyl-peptidase-1